jgi:hypothetical protein
MNKIKLRQKKEGGKNLGDFLPPPGFFLDSFFVFFGNQDRGTFVSLPVGD